jgi:hypothetical protein
MVEHLTQLLKEQIELMRAAAEVLGESHARVKSFPTGWAVTSP